MDVRGDHTTRITGPQPVSSCVIEVLVDCSLQTSDAAEVATPYPLARWRQMWQTLLHRSLMGARYSCMASPAMADGRNALSPGQEPRKAFERRRHRSEILSQVPNRMISGEIGETNGRALQERAFVAQRLVQPIEMCAQLIKVVGHRRQHYDGIDISTGELGPVFEKPRRQHFWTFRERDGQPGVKAVFGSPGKRCAAARRAGGAKSGVGKYSRSSSCMINWSSQ